MMTLPGCKAPETGLQHRCTPGSVPLTLLLRLGQEFDDSLGRLLTKLDEINMTPKRALEQPGRARAPTLMRASFSFLSAVN